MINENNTQIFVHFCTFNQFQAHTYIIYNLDKECIIIDPGCSNVEERQQLDNFIQQHALCVQQIINTHGHVDHTIGNLYIKNTYQAKLAIHPLDIPLLQNVVVYAREYGITNYEVAEADILLQEGDEIKIKDIILQVLHVPGHSPGHIALYCKSEKICFSGDVLFKGSIGRTDLLGGDNTMLLKSIQKKIFSLGDDVIIYPGHGPTTTIGQEKYSNPFCKNM